MAQAFERPIRLNPTYAQANRWHAELLACRTGSAQRPRGYRWAACYSDEALASLTSIQYVPTFWK
jgi:hypothetical protein